MPTIDETIAFIQKAHSGQFDKAGEVYWRHPHSVMQRLGDGATEEERQVALLHDVIEDTPHSGADLLALGYSASVVTAVELLSRSKIEPRPPYIDWINSIASSGNRLAIRIKIADNEDNLDPIRIAALSQDEREFVHRYEHSLAILRPALAALSHLVHPLKDPVSD